MSGPHEAEARTRAKPPGGANVRVSLTANLRELLSELSVEAPARYQRLRILPGRSCQRRWRGGEFPAPGPGVVAADRWGREVLQAPEPRAGDTPAGPDQGFLRG